MHAYERAAAGALPSPALELDEGLDPDPAQFLEILDHAHAVFGAIALVEPPEPGAFMQGLDDAHNFVSHRFGPEELRRLGVVVAA